MSQKMWLSIEALGEAVGWSRSHLYALKGMTSPDLVTTMNPASARKNQRIIEAESAIKWLNFHIKLSDEQKARVRDAAREILPSVRGEMA